MTDTVSRARRSEIMASIPTKGTAPELVVRRSLWRAGFRHATSPVWRLPGSPDLLYPSLRTTVFIHGCFWHGHKCRLGRIPKSNVDFWTGKIAINRRRDARVARRLRLAGWRVVTVWECSLKEGVVRARRVLDSERSEARNRLHRATPAWCNVVNSGLQRNAMKRAREEDSSDPTVRASVSFPKYDYGEIERIARDKRVSVAWVVREAVTEYLVTKADINNSVKPTSRRRPK